MKRLINQMSVDFHYTVCYSGVNCTGTGIMLEIKGYLTEEKLGTALKHIFKVDFIRDRRFQELMIRPDFVNHDLKIIVEFDGFRHYNTQSQINKDASNMAVYASRGYHTYRIPYFIQLDTETCFMLFDVQSNIKTDYPHGFVDRKALRPCDFNTQGINRLREDIKYFYNLILEDRFTLGRTSSTEAIDSVIESIRKPSVDHFTPEEIEHIYKISGANRLELGLFFDRCVPAFTGGDCYPSREVATGVFAKLFGIEKFRKIFCVVDSIATIS